MTRDVVIVIAGVAVVSKLNLSLPKIVIDIADSCPRLIKIDYDFGPGMTTLVI